MVYHQGACALYIITALPCIKHSLRFDDIQHFVLMICKLSLDDTRAHVIAKYCVLIKNTIYYIKTPKENEMDNFDKDFSNIFEGIEKTMNAIDGELDLLKQINAEQKEELRKAKRFNVFMLIIAIISLIIAIVSLIVTFSIK